MDNCPFCGLSTDRISIETESAIAFPDAYPVTAGHTLVIPRRHVTSLYELTLPEQQGLWDLVARVRRRLLEDRKVDGFNIGFNEGVAAGQTIEHAHIHIIPRKLGDTPDPRGGIRWVLPDQASYWRR